MSMPDTAPPDLEQIKLTLQRSPIMRALIDVAPEAMQEALKSEFYKAGTTLFREGEPGDRVYAILTGRLRVQHDMRLEQPVVLRDCFPGDVVGEVSLLDNQPRSASVLVVADSRLVSLSREDFQRIIGQRPEIMFELLRALSHRLRSSSDYIVATSRTVDTLSQQLAGLSGSKGNASEQAAQHLWHGLYLLIHDLRQSSQSIDQGIDTLKDRVFAAKMSDQVRDELEDVFGLVEAQASHSTHTLVDVEEMIVALSGDIPLVRGPVMLGELCDLVAARLNPLARMGGTWFEVEVAPNLPIVYADQQLLNFALRRLMYALIQQAPSGAPLRITVDDRFGREVQITVTSPETIALPAAFREAVFAPFFPLGERPGLELAAARAIMQLHGGSIGVSEGDAGEGMVFVLRLPIGFEHYDGIL